MEANQTLLYDEQNLKRLPLHLQKFQCAINEGILIFREFYLLDTPFGSKERAVVQEFRAARQQKDLKRKAEIIQKHKSVINRVFLIEKNEVHRLPETWKKYEEVAAALGPSCQERLNELKASWERHGRYSHYRPSNLTGACQHLEELEWLVEQAYRKISHSAKTKQQRQYQNYLKALNEQITREKQVLAEAMLIRCQIALHNRDLHCHDVEQDLRARLISLKILIGTQPIIGNEKRDRLPLAQFHTYMMRWGSQALREECQKLFSLNNETGVKVNLVSVLQDKGSVLVPEHLARAVPRSARRPLWLFRGWNKRYELFQNTDAVMLDLIAAQQLTQNSPFLPELGTRLHKHAKRTKTHFLEGFWKRINQ